VTASELRAAADTLDRAADAATEAPWTAVVSHETTGGDDPNVPPEYWCAEVANEAANVTVAYWSDTEDVTGNAAFIAVMDPALAKGFAALLREVAADLGDEPGNRADDSDDMDPTFRAALAVARAVNKEKP
jgi:hypothetical protein